MKRLNLPRCFQVWNIVIIGFLINGPLPACFRGVALAKDGNDLWNPLHDGLLAAVAPVGNSLSSNWVGSLGSYWLPILMGVVFFGCWLMVRKRRGGLRSQNRHSDFSAVAEKSDNAIVVLNESGRIEWVNAGFTKVTGFQPKESLGKLPGSLLAGSNPSSQVSQTIREGLGARRNFSIEVHSRHAQGHHHWLAMNFTPVFTDRKVFSHFVVVANDITARKRAEEALSRASRNNELILNAMNEGVCGMDINGLITFINSAATRMTGWKVSDIIGKPVSRLLYQLKTDGMPDIEEDHFLRVAFNEGKVLVGDADLFLRNDGNQFPVSYTTTPIFEADKLVGSVMVFRDISDQRQGEVFRARQGRQYALRAEVGFALATGDSQKSFLRACSQSFLKALDALCCRIWVFNPVGNTLELEANAGLVSGASEAIRSIPLGTMKIGMIARDRVANMTNDLPNDPDEIDKQWVKEEGLSSFVGLPLMLEGQLLAVIGVYSRFKFPPDTIDLLNSVSDSIGQGVLRKRAELRVVELSNLLNKINVASLLLDLNGRLLFWNERAQDTYGWNSEDMIGQAFDKYLFKERGEFLRIKKEVTTRGEWKRRAKHQTRNHGAIEMLTRWVSITDAEGNLNSLGLMINDDENENEAKVSSIVCEENASFVHPLTGGRGELREMLGMMAHQLEKLKGDISKPEMIQIFESSLKRGVSILHQINDNDSSFHDMSVPADPVVRGNGECILVVDDEPSQLELTRELLLKCGFVVVTATDGIEAVTAYSQNRDKIALVLTDLTMPHMDGVATIRTFKQLNSALPVLVVSGPDDGEDLRESVRVEGVIMHEKPLTAETILPSLLSALRGNPLSKQPELGSQAA